MDVQLNFTSDFSKLFEGLTKIADGLKSIRDQSQTTNKELQASAQTAVISQQEVEAAYQATIDVLGEFANAASQTAGVDDQIAAAQELEKSFDDAADSAKKLGDTQKKAGDDAKASAGAAAAAQGAANIKLNEAKTKALEMVSALKGVTEEQKLQLKEWIETSQSVDEIAGVIDGMSDFLGKTTEATKTLKQEIREAEKAAIDISREFGELSPQALEAQAKVGALKEEFNDFRERFDSFSPDKKFQAFIGIASSIAGAFTAAQGALGLFGAESENVARSIQKVQSSLALLQGLQAFFGGFQDSLKNVIALINNFTGVTKTATAATAASTAANTTATGAAVAQTGAVNGLSAAWARLTAFLLANPFVAAAAAIAAITVAMIAFSNETDNSKEDLDDLIDSIEEFKNQSVSLLSFRKQLAEIARQTESESANGDLKTELELQKKSVAESISFIEQEKQVRLTSIKELQYAKDEAIKIERESGEKADKEKIEQIESSIQTELLLVNELEREKSLIRAQGFVDEKKILNDIQEERDKKAKEEREKREKDLEKLKSDIDELNKRLKDSANTADIESTTDPRLRLQKEQEAALASIQILQDEIQKKQKLLTGSGELTADQEKYFASLRLQVNQNYAEGIAKIEGEILKIKLDALERGRVREIAEFDLSAKERIEKMRKLGVDEIAIQTIINNQRIELEKKLREELLKSQEETAILTAQLTPALTGENEVERERRVQLQIIEIKKEFALKRLADLSELNVAESDSQVLALRKLIQDLEKETGSILDKNKNKQFDLLDLLGINFDSDEAKQKFKQAINDTFSLIGEGLQLFFDSQNQLLEADKAANDAYIQNLDDRIDATQAALDQEYQLQAKGLASNVDLKKKELAQLQAEKQKALEKDKAIAKEQAELQQQQAVIDSLSQASSMAVTIANVFKAESGKGIVGVIAAAGAALGLVGLFLSLKAKFNDASKQQFEQGGTLNMYGSGSTGGTVKGKMHSQGGGHRIEGTNIWVEHDEEIIKRRSANKYRKTLKAINNEKFEDLTLKDVEPIIRHIDLSPLLEGTNVVINKEEKDNIVNKKIEYNNYQTNAIQAIDNTDVVASVNLLQKEMAEFKTYYKERPRVTPTPEGYMEEKPGQIRFVKVRKDN